jgi:hypothetical protein
MADSDDEIIREARSLTGFNENLIPPVEMQSLVSMAKEDIRGIATNELPDIYEDQAAERAVFWTTVMFTKVYMGELDAPNFSVGSIDVDSLPRRDIVRVWYRQLDQYVAQLKSGRAMGHGGPERSSRAYNDDWNRQQFN